MGEKFKSRKFNLTLLILLLASIFLAVEKLSGGEWIVVVVAVLGMYKVANVSEHKQENRE